jgi:hypothetical protein
MRATLLILVAAGCSNGGSNSAPDMSTAPDMTSTLRPPARQSIDAVLAGTSVFVYGGDEEPANLSMAPPQQLVDDLWRFDVSTRVWSQVSTGNAPGARARYAAALDSKRNRIVYFGGFKGTAAHPPLDAQVWSLDVASSTFTQLMPSGTGPGTRVGHRMVYDAAGDRVLLFGGDAKGMFNSPDFSSDVWELSFAASADGAWKLDAMSNLPTGPMARRDAALALDDAHGRLVMFGGAADFFTFFNDAWSWSLSTGKWTQATTSAAPSQRLGTKMEYDSPRDQLVLFGGHDVSPIGLMNDLYTCKLDAAGATAAFKQLLPGDTDFSIAGTDTKSPERREHHGFTRITDALFLYGGGGDCGPLDDTWSFDLTAPTAWQPVLGAMTGETCFRRAQPGQQCATGQTMECAAPF